MYDLPTQTIADKRSYQLFHKFLIKDGYDMLQYSLYSRICNSQVVADKHIARLKFNLPNVGNVRLLQVTEKQYASMEFLVGDMTNFEKITANNKQLFLF